MGLLFASCTKEEQRTLSVIPAPLKVELQQGVFPLNPETGLYIDASEGDKKILKDYLAASFMKLKPVAVAQWIAQQPPKLPGAGSSPVPCITGKATINSYQIQGGIPHESIINYQS